MQSLAIIGAQWGDEGKGKIADLLCAKYDLVVRYQGGNNAGHTIVVAGRPLILHLIPSGIFHNHCTSVIGHGVAFDPRAFQEELEYINKAGITVYPERLKISSRCSVITSYNKLLDAQRESQKETYIGTTVKGIGPTYEDKAARKALQLKDILDKDTLAKKLEHNLREKKVLFKHLYKVNYPPLEEEVEKLYALGKFVEPFLANTFLFLEKSLNEGKKILYEGAQGVLLDVDYGSYPYVTSSNTTIGGIYTGAGPLYRKVDEILGIAKAYMTRVGLGPFPTELLDNTGKQIQEAGKEFGATTGRKRRCGWMDLPLLKYAVKASGLTSIALTKIDVLNNVEKLRICYAYRYQGEIVDCAYPEMDLSQVTPLFKDMNPIENNFQERRGKCPNLSRYIRTIEEAVGLQIGLLSYGADRDETMFVKNYF